MSSSIFFGGSVLAAIIAGAIALFAPCCISVMLPAYFALSSVASSFWLALGLGTAYVFGMVAPLFAIALLWERLGGRVSRLFSPRAFIWRLGSLRRTLTATNLASGLLLALIGGGMLWV